MSEKIAIVGGAGAGKTTLSLALGAASGLPVYHVDCAYFEPGWKPRANNIAYADLAAIAAQPRWIIDGTDLRSIHSRIFLADLIIYLHVPAHIRAWRVLLRMLRNFRKTRLGSPEGCKGRLRLKPISWALFGYGRFVEPKLDELLDKVKTNTRIIHIRSKKDRAQLLALFPTNKTRGASDAPMRPQMAPSRRQIS